MTTSIQTSERSYWGAENLPLLPHRRRLSATAWQMQWKLTFSSHLESPETVDRFVRQFDEENLMFSARAISMRNLCLSVTAHNQDQIPMAYEAFRMIRELENQYGKVERIESRSVSDWPMYDEF